LRNLGSKSHFVDVSIPEQEADSIRVPLLRIAEGFLVQREKRNMMTTAHDDSFGATYLEVQERFEKSKLPRCMIAGIST